MRIALTNWSNRLVGGAEQYIAAISAALLDRGHEVGLWYQVSAPSDRPLIQVGPAVPQWDASRLGLRQAVDSLRAWRPDIVYCQGLLDPAVEEATQAVARSVFFAHNYHGTCITGGKTTMFPVIQPCDRTFGAACLLRFYPHRCGGLSPFTMWRDYRKSRKRLQALAGYDQVITHSSHTAREYTKHGIRCESVRFFVSVCPTAASTTDTWSPKSKWNLLMMGRMMKLKGGDVLLDALIETAKRLSRPVSLVLAGDGPQRANWEMKADRIQREHSEIEISFPGWLVADQRINALRNTDLMLLPSLWPEPFGMTGPEAGLWGIPSVAFAVGGIPVWLRDGINGRLASVNPASASSLADAIVGCLTDEERYRELRAGARRVSEQLSVEAHYTDLIRVFEAVMERPTLECA